MLLLVLAVMVAADIAGQPRSAGAPPTTNDSVARQSWVASAAPGLFQLPPRTAFDQAMPRYPNVWFYVDRTLVSSQKGAVDLVARHVRERMRGREYYGPFDNPEACDFEVRIEHLQPWQPREPPAHRALAHAHAFHLRYYYTALAAQGLDAVTVQTPTGPRPFYRLAASVHYEVEHASPLHADVEACPYCGRTGQYKELTGSLVEQVHDPLGLELLLTGAIRGDAVRFGDYEQRPVGGIMTPANQFTLESVLSPGQTGDRNTLRVAVVVITGSNGR